MRVATLHRQPLSRRLASRPRTLGFVAAATAAGLLGLLHLWLLGVRLAAGDFADPVVVLRWAAAAALVGCLAALRRQGVRLLWGRQALAFWVLVLLLHWNTAGPADEAASPQTGNAAPQLVVLLPPAGALGALLLGAFVLALAACGVLPTDLRRAPRQPAARGARPIGSARLQLPLAPRPPPALA